MNKKEQSLIVVTSLVSAQVLHEALDELEGTIYYRQSLKAVSNKMQNALATTLDTHIARLWDIDEETMIQVQEGIEAISKELASLDPARIAELGDMLKNKELVFVKD